jgi:hypothetical protein
MAARGGNPTLTSAPVMLTPFKNLRLSSCIPYLLVAVIEFVLLDWHWLRAFGQSHFDYTPNQPKTVALSPAPSSVP